jgi:hypothetical protein
VNLGRLVHQGATTLLAQLGRVRVAVLFDGMAHREGEDFLLGAADGDAAVALAGNAATVDHFAGTVWHKDLEVVRVIEYYGRASVTQASNRQVTTLLEIVLEIDN